MALLELRPYISLLAVLFLMPNAHGAAIFTPLGDLPGRTFMSYATRVSSDGGTVIGSSDSIDGQVGFRWNAAGGMQRVPMPPGSGNFAQGTNGVSNNGSIIVGDGWGPAIPFRWTAATGSAVLPTPSNANATAMDVSSDGFAMAGLLHSSTPSQLISWDGLGFHTSGIFIPPNSRVSIADASGGYVIAGSHDIGGGSEGFLWSPMLGFRSLGDLGTGTPHSYVRDISPNGLVAVGRVGANQPNGPAAMWTDTAGWQVLPNPFGNSYGGTAESVSADGTVIVGQFDTPAGVRPFFWDKYHGVRMLDDLLSVSGAGLGSYQLRFAYDVSADGLTVVGSATNPSGFTEGWRATLPASVIPEPSSAALVLAACAVGLRRHRGHRKNIRAPKVCALPTREVR